MRQLNTDEIFDKFRTDAYDVKYCDFNDLTFKLDQFFNFLLEQEISNRVLQRIEEDFQALKSSMTVERNARTARFSSDIVSSLKTRELQGAFGFFIINKKFLVERKTSNHYIDNIREWYRVGTSFSEWQQKFNTYFFEPFTELFEWYLSESETKISSDYFSVDIQNKIFEKLEELKIQLDKLGFGQEIVFDEVNDVKKLTKKLNKKNWTEIVKGKFIDLALGGIISIETAQKVIVFLTGDEIKLLP